MESSTFFYYPGLGRPRCGIKPKGMWIETLSAPAVSDRTPVFQGPTFFTFYNANCKGQNAKLKILLDTLCILHFSLCLLH
jgi:hypothetical protein